MDVAFNVTRRCNKGCDYCYLKLSDDDLPVNALLESLNAVAAQTVTLTGGEPLMHPDIVPMIQELSRRQLHIHLLSNGLRLDEAFLDAIGVADLELYVTYNEPHERVQRNLSRAHARGLPVNIHHVLTRETVGELERVCGDLPFMKSISLLYPTRTEQNDVQMYGPAEWFALLDRATSITLRQGVRTFFEQAYVLAGSPIANALPCPAGEDLFIDVNAQAYPCCLLVDGVPGSVKAEPVRYSAARCEFLLEHPSPDPHYVRICPIVLTERLDGHFRFPSRMEGSHD